MKKLLLATIATILLIIGIKINSEPENLIGFTNMFFLSLLYIAFIYVAVFTDTFESKK
jgi:heme O synthase-like polyprenyltransferase